MEKNKFENVKVLDCSIRDGGHLNKWKFSKEFVKSYYNSVKDSGIEFIEIGYRTSPNLMKECGIWRFTPESLIKEILDDDNKIKLAIMVDIGKINEEDFSEKKNSKIDLIRIAFYKTQIDEAIDLSKKLNQKGYLTTFNMMGISHYTKEELDIAIEKMKTSPVDVVYIADSFGSLLTEDVKDLINKLKETNKEIGFHPHNNLQMSFPNTLAAIESGATYIDGTVNGMGRGAGNLPLEMILPFLNKFKKIKYNPIPIFEFIETDLIETKNKLNWGYHMPYLLTGFKSCHPNYSLTLKKRGYSIGQIDSILNLVDSEKSVGFDLDILESAIKKYESSNLEKLGEEGRIPVIAILPCRAGSQRVKQKNIRKFGGQSLLRIKLNQLLRVPELDKIIVTTDDPVVMEICQKIDSPKIFINQEIRPKESYKNTDELIKYVAGISKENEHILWTHVTSPFIDEQTYSKAINTYLKNLKDYDSLISVQKLNSFIWNKQREPINYDRNDSKWPRTQNIEPLYEINSGIFLINSSLMKQLNDRIGENPYYFECNSIENLDIDWPEDFKLAETLWEALSEKYPKGFKNRLDGFSDM
ncbi:hypothetical protein HOA59_02220 [archaeon]|jgi:4-hydroxy 2-oxovalerate aldolase|nr:hypothetical protein [archaeon]MBT6824231.1 hypothetical protein [archaeon]MBT7106769.1 hypothetical protein [archaeon]MBT7297537.1 hypothetical protein [archaeon]